MIPLKYQKVLISFYTYVPPTSQREHLPRIGFLAMGPQNGPIGDMLRVVKVSDRLSPRLQQPNLPGRRGCSRTRPSRASSPVLTSCRGSGLASVLPGGIERRAASAQTRSGRRRRWWGRSTGPASEPGTGGPGWLKAVLQDAALEEYDGSGMETWGQSQSPGSMESFFF